MSNTEINELVDSNLRTLKVAVELLAVMSVEELTQTRQPCFESSPGKHLRHILDHYLCFRRDLPKGLIDYDWRQRDCQLETNKDYMLDVIHQLSDFLEGLRGKHTLEKPLSVQMCNDVSSPQGASTQSTLGRELQFLQSHSVHHYALIVAMLRFSGRKLDVQFGVAPATLLYEATLKASA